MNAFAEGDVRSIPLTRGYSTIVDAEDYDWLMQWKWQAVFGRGMLLPHAKHGVKRIAMHRMILNTQPGHIVDHINRNPLDNRRINLRFVDKFQSAENTGSRRNNTSGFRGICFHATRRTWNAVISYKGKCVCIGYYKTKEEAARAYDKTALELRGPDFAQLNFPLETRER